MFVCRRCLKRQRTVDVPQRPLQRLQAGTGWLVATHRISEKGIEIGRRAGSGQQRLVSRGVSRTADWVSWALVWAPLTTNCAVQSALWPASRSELQVHTMLQVLCHSVGGYLKDTMIFQEQQSTMIQLSGAAEAARSAHALNHGRSPVKCKNLQGNTPPLHLQ